LKVITPGGRCHYEAVKDKDQQYLQSALRTSYLAETSSCLPKTFTNSWIEYNENLWIHNVPSCYDI